MKIRTARESSNMRTDIVERDIIGGSSDNSQYSFGYIQADDGITAMPSPAKMVPGLKMTSPYRVERVTEPGCCLYVNKYGQFYALTPAGEDKSTYIAQFPMGQFFTGLVYFNNYYTMAVCGANSLYLIKNNVKYATYSMPRGFRCGCFHCGRIFARDATEPYTVRWSGVKLNDWEESPDGAGYIVLDLHYGEIKNMFELGDKVVILRKYGITVLRALGDTRNFAVDAVKGYEFSVPVENPYAVLCRGKLFFSTPECIYSFDGSKLERIVPHRKEKLSGFANPQCYQDRYIYFECYTDKSESRYILEYDLDTGRSGLFCKDADCFWRDEYGIHFFRENYLYSSYYGETDDDGEWLSEEYDLGTDSVKTLKSIYAEGEGPLKITVTADGISRTFEGTGEKKVMLRGRKFIFKVNGCADVRRLSAKWEVSA